MADDKITGHPAAIRATYGAFNEQAGPLAELVEQVRAAAWQVSTGDSALDSQIAALAKDITAAMDGTAEGTQNAAALLPQLGQLASGHSGQEDQDQP
jgi:hypothetical protein